jgi:phosphoenolpyruvate carboxylase
MSAAGSDASLRRDVRLLGETLGRVLVAQGGDDLLADEERIRELSRAVSAVLEIVEARRLLDRHPVVQRSIDLRNPYVDPMNAIQVELLARYRDPLRDEAERDRVRAPLLCSIAGIAAALRNTG